MNTLLAIAALTTTTVSASITPEMKDNLATIQRDGIAANSSFGRHLINTARRVEDGQALDMSFVSDYSIKFLGCHHVTQWASADEQEDQNNNQNANANNQYEDVSLNAANGRIRSKGLVRFRLCPSGSCSNNFGVGCSSNYGEYVVDMVQFLQVYITWQMEETAAKCSQYRSSCYKQCYSSSNLNCYTNCYRNNGVEVSLCAAVDSDGNNQFQQVDGTGNTFDLQDYLECAAYAVTSSNGDELTPYLGPYCSTQGGDIRLGFFQDEYCSLPSAYQASYFEKQSGVEIPFTKSSIVSTSCMSCEAAGDQNVNADGQSDYYNYDADGSRNYYVAKEVNDLCGTMYMQSGKCETNLNKDDVPYPEEGACTYIESVKRLKGDGIIRADQQVSSKPAAISIGVFTSLAVLLGGYVYYLKSKIARSRVNLAGASTSLA